MAQIITANGAAPATPAAGNTTLYSKSDKTMAYKDDAGTEHVLVEVSSGAANIPSNMNFAGVGARILGDFSNATIGNRPLFQSSTTNGNTYIGALPNGAGTKVGWSSGNYVYEHIVNGIIVYSIDPATNNFLLTGGGGFGYGAGSGGTVTQLTSKSTAVTLNKLSGQITMNNAALAAGATVTFVVNNSLVTTMDTVSLALSGGIASQEAYEIWPGMGAGLFAVSVKNISAGPLSEAIRFNFNVFKGSNA